MCCSELQCVAVCCSVLQCDTYHTLYIYISKYVFKQCVAVSCSELQCVAVCCSVTYITHYTYKYGNLYSNTNTHTNIHPHQHQQIHKYLSSHSLFFLFKRASEPSINAPGNPTFSPATPGKKKITTVNSTVNFKSI